MSDTPEAPGQDAGDKRYETICGLTLAMLAAVLAVVDLGGGKFGEDELIAHSEKAGAYLWYQSKGIKQSLAEGQRDIIKSLLDAGAIGPDKAPAVGSLLTGVEEDIARYGKEKKEILLGSAKVGKENWVQDVGGELGKVKGAKEWEERTAGLNDAGDVFDVATLFLQLCLVMGAISLVLQQNRLRWGFFTVMVLLGALGGIYGYRAFSLALAVP